MTLSAVASFTAQAAPLDAAAQLARGEMKELGVFKKLFGNDAEAYARALARAGRTFGESVEGKSTNWSKLEEILKSDEQLRSVSNKPMESWSKDDAKVFFERLNQRANGRVIEADGKKAAYTLCPNCAGDSPLAKYGITDILREHTGPTADRIAKAMATYPKTPQGVKNSVNSLLKSYKLTAVDGGKLDPAKLDALYLALRMTPSESKSGEKKFMEVLLSVGAEGETVNLKKVLDSNVMNLRLSNLSEEEMTVMAEDLQKLLASKKTSQDKVKVLREYLPKDCTFGI